ncbi:HD domain-containing phosphohydrolase [uncultured Oxalicibacterium sp.]|uniref:HD domain-containing phosphohydrolase n=1 Tax=uncultured Oxalicibacterium sp. TaxID=1168540 RepID=UPI0025FDF620|nr:HD domain-containing phosphohydrolase [uncultured Oxalicibacterium sp.]
MNVLIVDDDRTNLALFSHLLEGIPEATLIEESDPEKALDWCASHQVDVLLLDYMMPKMDGLNFLQQFRQLYGDDHVPVIMVTADAQLTVRHEALLLSANDFMTKPVNKLELRARVANMLALRRSQRQQAERADALMHDVAIASEEARTLAQELVTRLTAAAGYRDPETGAHLQRMAHYARLIARNLGLSEEEQDLIFRAAPLHDVGKIGIPDHILHKPGKLTDEEMAIMRTHPVIGAALLKDARSPLMQRAAQIALSHHEKFDGTGYPAGLKGEDIPLGGRIVAVADVFDALTSIRPYKPAWSQEQALEWMQQGAGTHFDPACVAAFKRDLVAVRYIRDAHLD